MNELKAPSSKVLTPVSGWDRADLGIITGPSSDKCRAEREANAALIAAAPELLAVLQSLLSYVKADGEVHGPVVGVAELVIAKAGGAA